jgi:NAD(P)-dependent dehydrogenase (short-subunit alcohol dehydrogenase family)
MEPSAAAGSGAVTFDFSGRVALVTGGGSGIGFAIARGFLQSGGSVVINGRNEERLERARSALGELSSAVLPRAGDVRNWDFVQSMLQQTVDRFGRLDVLFNNAGGNFSARTEDLSPNGWRALIDTNLTSVFYCSKATFPIFKQQGGGVIVNIGSLSAFVPNPYRVAYGAAKAGVRSLTQSLANEWAPYGIRVNCVAPGSTLTEGWKYGAAAQQEAEQVIPLRRLGTPEEVAAVALFVASDSASYLTGETIRVEGGPRYLGHRSGVVPS